MCDVDFVFYLLGIYQTGNQVVIRVEVLGTIVSVDDREKLTIYGGKYKGI